MSKPRNRDARAGLVWTGISDSLNLSNIEGVDRLIDSKQPGETRLRKSAILLAVVLAASAIGNCKSVKLVASVKNPGYSGQHLRKVLVIGMSNDPAIRSDFEDAMASKLARDGVEAVPGHTILLRPESANMNMDYLKAQIREHHIEAVLVSHLVRVDKSITYIPGQSYMVPYPYYNSFYGYYPVVYQQVYSPDYLREDHTVRIETNLYATAAPEGELVWTGISDSFNPSSAKKAIDAIVKVVVKDLEKEGIF